MSYSYLFAQLQPFTLAGAGISITDTSIVLTYFKTIDGVNLTMTDFGTIGFGTLEPGNGINEEQISFSGITQNSNGTATLTGVKTVLMISPYTQTSGITKTHAGGTVFVISNTSGLYKTIIDYIDGIAISGSPDSTTTTKGIVKMSVTPVSAASPIAVGDNDTRVPTADPTTLFAPISLVSFYPVGSIYINAAVSTNPSTLLGFGTWTEFAKGKVLVGVNTLETEFDALGETGGEKTHVLTEAEMPAHTHDMIQGNNANSQVYLAEGGTSAGTVAKSGQMASVGGDGAHNNLQPYITVYMWQRTV